MGDLLTEKECKTDNQLIRYFHYSDNTVPFFDVDPIGLTKKSKYIASPSDISDYILGYMNDVSLSYMGAGDWTKESLFEYWKEELPKKHLIGFWITVYSDT